MDGYPIALTLPERIHADISEGTPLCSALEIITNDRRLNRETLIGLPWLSPILGSGCLDLGDGPPLDPKALAGLKKTVAVAAAAATFDPGAVKDLHVSVLGFVKRLVGARAPGTELVNPADDGEEGAATHLVAVAALLTEAFHEGSRLHLRPIGQRFLDMPIALGGGGSGDLVSVIRELVVMIRSDEACLELAGMWGTTGLWKDIANHILSNLNRVDDRGRVQAVISGADVQLLSEFAWLAIVRDSSLYPGWSDLLVGLWGAFPPGGKHRGIRNASTDLGALAEEVAKILGPITEASWKSWTSGDQDGDVSTNTERRSFYAEIARLLSLQGTIRKTLQPWNPKPKDQSVKGYEQRHGDWSKRGRAATDRAQQLTNETRAHASELGQDVPKKFKWVLPRPTVVVTSFDLELEMAFWSQGEAFVEVLPVLAKPSQGNRPGAIVWLAAKFDPAAACTDLDHQANTPQPTVLRSSGREWFLLSTVLDEWSNFPTIIRLSGSPMIKVSPVDLSASFYEATGFNGPDSLELIHALTIDDYSSLTFAAHELYSVASGTSPTQGLPLELLRGTPAMSRVWVSFGVQVDDSAVRTRLFSQLSVSSIPGTKDLLGRAAQAEDDAQAEANAQAEYNAQAEDNRKPGGTGRSGFLRRDEAHSATNGVAFNRRFTEVDTAVMRWLGFEFDEVKVEDLIVGVNHCGEHLEHIAGLLATKLQDWPREPVDELPDIDLVNWCRALPMICPLHGNGGHA